MEDGIADLVLYLPIDQYYLFHPDAADRGLASSAEDAAFDCDPGSPDGFDAGAFTKEIQSLVKQVRYGKDT